MKLSPRACRRAAAAPGQRPARGEPSLPPSLFPVPVSPPPCPAGAGAARRTAAAARMLPPLPGLCRAAPGGGRHPRPRPALSDAPSIHSAPPARPGVGARHGHGQTSLPLSLVPSLAPASPEFPPARGTAPVRRCPPSSAPAAFPSFFYRRGWAVPIGIKKPQTTTRGGGRAFTFWLLVLFRFTIKSKLLLSTCVVVACDQNGCAWGTPRQSLLHKPWENLSVNPTKLPPSAVFLWLFCLKMGF